MKTVIETPSFLATAREAGLADDMREFIVATISDDPMMGDMMAGTGGCRKSRFPGRGKGKRGGYRTVHYNGPDDVPVLLLVVLDKGDRDNLSHEERNELRKLVQAYAAEYRAGVAAKVTQMKEGA
ncbi:MAG: type II toxin-antitoxin system RelE/ParE family toxin [Xanthobacteraceae bacterium]|jgi:hypothetical protein